MIGGIVRRWLMRAVMLEIPLYGAAADAQGASDFGIS